MRSMMFPAYFVQSGQPPKIGIQRCNFSVCNRGRVMSAEGWMNESAITFMTNALTNKELNKTLPDGVKLLYPEWLESGYKVEYFTVSNAVNDIVRIDFELNFGVMG